MGGKYLQVGFMKATLILIQKKEILCIMLTTVDQQNLFLYNRDHLYYHAWWKGKNSKPVLPLPNCTLSHQERGSGARGVRVQCDQAGHHRNPDVITSACMGIFFSLSLLGKRNNELLKFKLPLTLKS